jgi:acyl-CoA thioesterase-1
MRVKYCNTVLLGSLFGCGGGDQPGLAADRREESSGGPGAASHAPLVLVVGTSLTAGYGLDPDEAWPAALERRLRAAGYPHRVIAAGVSGETSAGALRRIDWLLERYQPAVFILETGGNDGLRGLRPDSLQANLVAILRRAAALSPPPTLVLLAMEAPPNYGRRYTEAFRLAYRQAAEATGAVLVPFFLEGVAGVDSLNLSDGIHPRPEGHELAADNVWRVLRSVLGERVGG